MATVTGSSAQDTGGGHHTRPLIKERSGCQETARDAMSGSESEFYTDEPVVVGL